MQRKIRVEIVFTLNERDNWDEEIAAGIIQGHLEYTVPHLPWIKDNVQNTVIKKVEEKK